MKRLPEHNHAMVLAAYQIFRATTMKKKLTPASLFDAFMRGASNISKYEKRYFKDSRFTPAAADPAAAFGEALMLSELLSRDGFFELPPASAAHMSLSDYGSHIAQRLMLVPNFNIALPPFAR
jgi:hypothetical protein